MKITISQRDLSYGEIFINAFEDSLWHQDQVPLRIISERHSEDDNIKFFAFSIWISNSLSLTSAAGLSFNKKALTVKPENWKLI